MRIITANPYGSKERSILKDALAKLMLVCGMKIEELYVVNSYI